MYQKLEGLLLIFSQVPEEIFYGLKQTKYLTIHSAVKSTEKKEHLKFSLFH